VTTKKQHIEKNWKATFYPSSENLPIRFLVNSERRDWVYDLRIGFFVWEFPLGRGARHERAET